MKMRNIVFAVLSIIASSSGSPCSRVLHVEKGLPVLVGRTMDWFEDMHTNIYVFPRGIEKEGYAAENPIRWTSKYGSMVVAAYDQIAAEGMNEKGLAAHLLDLNDTDYGKRDPNIPGLAILLVGEYYLDNFQTVDEAVKFTEENKMQVVFSASEGLHIALEDVSGDSAIIEYIAGKPVIYHNREYKVMTNSPTYDKQLANLKNYVGLGGDKSLPGSVKSKDRFVRGAYFEKYLPQAENARSEIMNMFSVIHNLSEPFGSLAPGRSEYIPTIYEVVLDLTHQTYYFHSTMSFNTVYAQLSKFDLNPGAPVMKLDLVNNPDLAGDVTDKFSKSES